MSSHVIQEAENRPKTSSNRVSREYAPTWTQRSFSLESCPECDKAILVSSGQRRCGLQVERGSTFNELIFYGNVIIIIISLVITQATLWWGLINNVLQACVLRDLTDFWFVIHFCVHCQQKPYDNSDFYYVWFFGNFYLYLVKPSWCDLMLKTYPTFQKVKKSKIRTKCSGITPQYSNLVGNRCSKFLWVNLEFRNIFNSENV